MSSIAPSSQPKLPALIPPWLTGPWGMVGLLSILYTFTFIVWTQFHWGGEENVKLITDLSALPLGILVLLLARRVALQKGLDLRFRRAWLLFGLASFSLFLGQAAWFYVSSVLHAEPFPSIADVFLLASYPLLLGGIMTLPGAHQDRHQRILFWFDLLSMLTTASMFVSFFLIIPTAQGNDTGLLTKFLATAYPIGDLMLVSGVLSLLLRLPDNETRAALRLQLIGLGFFVASDLAFGYTSLRGTYIPGYSIDAGWMLAKVFMILGALRQLYRGPVPAAKPRWTGSLQDAVKLLPLITLLLGYGLAGYIALTDFNETVEWIFIAAAFLSVLMIARQVYIASFSATSVRTKLILTFLLVCVPSLELVSIFTYFALRSHPASVWQVFGVTTMVVILLATGAAIFLAQRFAAPISRLTSVAHQIAAGDLTAKAQVESQDEIGTLASTFNTMLETLSRTQKELQESESLYRSLVDHSPDVITVYSRGKILFINPAGVKVLGAQNAEDLVGQHILELLPTQDRKRVRQGIEELQTIKESTPLIQQTMHRLDGTTFEAEFRAIPIVYKGEPAVQFVMRDITERKRLEEQWQKFKQGIERSSEAVFMTDVDGKISFINPAFEKLYGYIWDEAIGQTPRILKSGSTPPEVYQQYWEMLSAKRAVAVNHANRARDGRLIDIEGSHNPILDETGSLVGFLAVHRDVTERKRAEKQIRQNAARVEALARVASILNSRLNLNAVAQAICEETARALAVPVVTVRLVNVDYDELFLVGQIGRKPEHIPAVVPLLRPAYEAILQQPSALIMQPEWNQAENERNAKLYGELDLCVGVHASLVHNGRLVGMLSLKTIGETREFTGDELDLIKGLADQAGLAISKAQLFAEVERQKDDLEVRVAQRTEELKSLNQRLQDELAERQRSEEALRQSEEKYRTIFENVQDVFYTTDYQGHIVTVSPSIERHSGYCPEEVLGSHVRRFFLHEQNYQDLENAVNAQGMLNDFQMTMKRKDGSIIYVSAAARVVFDEDGQPVGTEGVLRDITERQHLIQSLRESEEQFRLLFEASPDAIVLIDPNDPQTSWPIVDCNEAASQMNGYLREELIGRSIDLLNEAPSDVAERKEYLEFLRQEGVLHRDGVHRHKDGTVFPIEVSTSLIRFAGRELVLGIDRDITERKQTELALQEAKELAEAASRAKSEFLSRMSHELRTPMNAILGFAQLLEMSYKEPLSSTQKVRVKQIVKGGQHLLDLINEILDISRIEADRLHISPEPVSIRESIQDVLDLTVPLAVKRHIQIVTKSGGLEDHPFVMADRQRLKQVLLNLLGNAVKYNHDGGSVLISCEQVPSNRWHISITDTGPGISQENLSRLFVPFERLGADQPNVEGTGLGLVLAKRLVELMHGQIGVESTLGRGSTFWIELPLTESPVDHLQRAGVTRELPTLSAAARTILYVEDNVANFDLIQQVLADYSQIELVWSADIKTGIELAHSRHPNLILLDLHLGGMDGAEILRQLKQEQDTAEIPVVVVSADATPGQIKRLLSWGAHAYLTKPLDVRQFVRLVEELLAEKVA